jgi:predicted regulator of Ras-like GTPase activity (Roadblock/LC7/MglB family)
MAFREYLQEICAAVDGAVVCSVMGFDGIAIDTFESRPSPDLDIPVLLVEYTTILNQVRAAADVLQSGQVRELVVSTDKLTAISRPLSPEYFLVLAIAQEANWGKARYMMRIVAPRVAAEF